MKPTKRILASTAEHALYECSIPRIVDRYDCMCYCDCAALGAERIYLLGTKPPIEGGHPHFDTLTLIVLCCFCPTLALSVFSFELRTWRLFIYILNPRPLSK